MIVEELASLAPVIDKLVAAHVNMDQPGFVPAAPTDAEADAETSAQKAKSRAAVGGDDRDGHRCDDRAAPDRSRNEMTELITKAGDARPQAFLPAPTSSSPEDNAGSKLNKAQALGIETITPEELAERLAAHLT